MGSKPKIDAALVNRWLGRGKSQTWIAQQFNCSPQAISKHAKNQQKATARYMVEDGLKPVIKHKINAIEQLTNINRAANKLLDLLERWSDGDEEAIRILESQTKMVNIGTRQEPQMMEMATVKDPRELMIRVMGEIRMQMQTALDIQKTMYHVEEVKDILDDIISIVKEHVEPAIQKLIADAVIKRKSLKMEVK